ncbi:MAG: cytochrome c3 family protein [Gammaproteobacteria bacterium]
MPKPSNIARATVKSALGVAVLLLFMAVAEAAQQFTHTPEQEVPDNIAPHPAPVQPVPYSHKLHLAQGLQCQFCHTNPAPGKKMAFPPKVICSSCHNTIVKNKPALVTLDRLTNSDQPIPWVRVYRITPGVNWSHRVHLQAGMQCIMCHGDVSRLEAMAKTTAVTSMASCIGCHQSHNAGSTCNTCHAWPADTALGLKTSHGKESGSPKQRQIGEQ